MTEEEAEKWLKEHLTGPINGGAAETCAKAVGGRLAALVNGSFKQGKDDGVQVGIKLAEAKSDRTEKLARRLNPDWGRVDG